MFKAALIIATTALSTGAIAQDQTPSVALGERMSIIGGCHDCHSAGYGESNGKIDPATALKGNPVGYSGPWGTTYAVNLRLVAADKSEDEWVDFLKTFETAPPMPWFNVRHFTDTEMRSLHMYIVSLGDPGDPAPTKLPPGENPKTPYNVFAPPVMPN